MVGTTEEQMRDLKTGASSDRKPKQILVVEDEEPIRALLELTLSEAGYDVTTVHEAREALQRLAAHPYDVILSDYKMPSMDGIAFYKHVCALTCEPPMRFILLTGAVLCPEVLAFLGEHPVRALPKPFFPDDVTQAVAEALRTETPMILPS